LNGWRADTRWIGGIEAALAYLDRMPPGDRPVLVVDGRGDPLPALSFVHRAAAGTVVAPFILFIAMPNHAERIADLADGAFDNVLAAPVSEAILGNALHALPFDDFGLVNPAAGVAGPAVAESGPRPMSGASRVTPITAHPRFVADPAEAVDVVAISNLRELGDDEFLAELLEAFRDETRPIMDRISGCAAEADLAGFRSAVAALRRCAGNLGGARLCDAASALGQATEQQLREHGGEYLHRLAAELVRLDAALVDLLGAPEARRQ
jgi:HPt (histidine-containing phosphotransfer) domain-containing protein